MGSDLVAKFSLAGTVGRPPQFTWFRGGKPMPGRTPTPTLNPPATPPELPP